MQPFVLQREQIIRRPLQEVWPFFAKAENLNELTPPWLDFRILTAPPIEMAVDTRILYSIRLRGVPMWWRTRILVWEPPHRFIDVQESGPYRMWHHMHTFESCAEGVRMTDRVRYLPPLGPLGKIMHNLWIRKDVEAIFDYRYQRVEELFNGPRAPVRPVHEPHID